MRVFADIFVVTRDGDTYIVMDAPPDKEALAPFVTLRKCWPPSD